VFSGSCHTLQCYNVTDILAILRGIAAILNAKILFGLISERSDQFLAKLTVDNDTCRSSKSDS